MVKRFVVAMGLLLGCGLAVNASAAVAAEQTCPTDGKMHFICGPLGAEDLLQLADSKWMVASGMGTGGLGPANKDGGLYLIDTDAKTARPFYPGSAPMAQPDKALYPDCPGPPDAASYNAHGLALAPGADGELTLLAVNHGREAVEVFDISLKGEMPQIAWIGCVLMPPGTSTNSVAALPGGGFVATKFFDPTKDKALADLMAGKISGLVYQWTPGGGFSVVPGSAMSGPNGIAVSKDGHWVYVAAFGSHELVRLSRDGSSPERQAMGIGFAPDNLRWTEDGKLLVAGVNPAGPETCNGRPCPKGWTVLAWDPTAMTTTTVLSMPASSPMTGVSAATEARGYLWIGSFNDSKIGYIPAE